MNILTYIADLFAGFFLCNCIPHLVAGLQGQRFQSPFAKPPGVGESSPLVNVIWGGFNLLAGVLLLVYAPILVSLDLGFILFCVGAAAIGIHLSRHFGKVRNP